MKNLFRLLGVCLACLVFLFLMAVTLSPMAYGQLMMVQDTPDSGSFGGCVDSPENPTLILAGLAGVGFIGNDLRRRRYKATTTKDANVDPKSKTNDSGIVP